MKKMKKQLSIIFLACLGLLSCDNDDSSDSNPDKISKNYVHSVKIGENTKLNLFENLEVGETNTNNSKTHSMSAYIATHNDFIYIIEPMDSKLYKYKQVDGELKQVATTLMFDQGAFPISIIFASSEKAYVPCAMSGNLAVINLTTMTKIKDIPLQEYTYPNGPTQEDGSPEPATGVISDGVLYLCLSQDKAQYNPHMISSVLLIDTSDDTVIKHLKDSRAAQSSAYYPFSQPIVDEKGDVYIYNVGGFSGMADGFLRIKKGSQEFDPNYFFSISQLTGIEDVNGGVAAYMYNKVYTNAGKVYAYLYIPGNSADPNNPQASDKTMQAFKIDLYNETVKKLELPASSMNATCICVSGDNVVFGMETTSGTGYFVYDHKTDKAIGLKVKTNGGTPFEISGL